MFLADKTPPKLIDHEGFWITNCTNRCTGGTITYAYHKLPNGYSVFQSYYYPWSLIEEPHSTYRVYPDIYDLPGNCKEDTLVVFLLEKHVNVNLDALSYAELSVWSPDGEGELCVEFGDMEVEEALDFAASLEIYENN